MQQTQKTKDAVRQNTEALNVLNNELKAASAGNADTDKLKGYIDIMERCMQQLRNAVWRNELSVLLAQQSSN